jgi:succinyl-CoA synthetase beta subunit
VFVVKSADPRRGRGKGTFEGLVPTPRAACASSRRRGRPQDTPRRCWGRTRVTIQTGPKGKQVNRLYIEEGADIARELYLSLLVDRETSKVAVVASTEGGMDIEAVAHDTPEKINHHPDRSGHGRHAPPRPRWPRPGLEGDTAKQAARVLGHSIRPFNAKGHGDAGVNPLSSPATAG